MPCRLPNEFIIWHRNNDVSRCGYQILLNLGYIVQAQSSSAIMEMRSIMFTNKLSLPLCLPGAIWLVHVSHPTTASTSSCAAELSWQCAEAAVAMGRSSGCWAARSQLEIRCAGGCTAVWQRWQFTSPVHLNSCLGLCLIPDPPPPSEQNPLGSFGACLCGKILSK